MGRPWNRRKELNEELDSHFRMAVQDRIAAGASEQEALESARREFGNIGLVKEVTRDIWGWTPFENLFRDLRYALRQLRNSPGFTLTAVLSLALGIGANAALFQLLDALVLRSLPVPSPQQLVRIHLEGHPGRRGQKGPPPSDFTYPQWKLIRAGHGPFQGISAWAGTRFNLAPAGEVRYVNGVYVSGSFFHTLGVSALIGRVFTKNDDRPGCEPGAVIGYSFWQSQFGGDPSALGQTLMLNANPVPIIGVTPRGFTGINVGKRFDFALPLCAESIVGWNGMNNVLDSRAVWWLGIIGRLKPGVSVKQASVWAESVSPSVLQATVDPNWPSETVKKYLKIKFGAVPGGNGFSNLSQAQDTILLLLSVAGLVLLIACANLANVLLARATVRQREIATRMALGASRWRVVRQLLSEILLLALLGGALGVVFAQGLSRFLLSWFSAGNQSFFLNLSPDWRTVLFIISISALACLLFGLAPALRSTRPDQGVAIRTAGRSMTTTRERFGLQRLLVVSQVALSLILLVASLLFVRSFRNLTTLDPGFREQGILAVDVAFTHRSIPKKRAVLLFREMLDRLRAAPGIDSAATVLNMPITGASWGDHVQIDNVAGNRGNSKFNRVSSHYFQTMGMRLLAGRDFNTHDTLSSPEVAIVDQTFASRFFPGQNPIGKRFHVPVRAGRPPRDYRIVGVVEKSKYADLQTDFAPMAFVPFRQDRDPDREITFVVHSKLPLASAISEVRTAIEHVNANLSFDFDSLPALIHNSVRREDLMARLSSIFGLLAVLLATLGLYGVMSYIVTQRRNEIGIRLALGANRPQILKMIFRESAVLLIGGIAAGTVLSLIVSRAAASLLFKLKPDDPVTIASATVVLSFVTFLATLIPARRASSIEPMNALRIE